MVVLFVGNRVHLKEKMLLYCLNNFDKEKLWLVDTLQIFDPYWCSRKNERLARQMLASIKIARPFTLHQFKSKMFSLTKMNLTKESTVLISSWNCFEGLAEEKKAIDEALQRLMKWLPCKFVVGVSKGEKTWEEQLFQLGMKLKHSSQNSDNTSSVSKRKIECTLKRYMQT